MRGSLIKVTLAPMENLLELWRIRGARPEGRRMPKAARTKVKTKIKPTEEAEKERGVKLGGRNSCALGC